MTPARAFNYAIKKFLGTENSSDIVCPFAKTETATCIARDGDMAIENNSCVSCKQSQSVVCSIDIKQFTNRKQTGKFLFYFAGTAVFEGDETHQILERCRIEFNGDMIAMATHDSKQISKQLKKL